MMEIEISIMVTNDKRIERRTISLIVPMDAAYKSIEAAASLTGATLHGVMDVLDEEAIG